ncbi:restriction endonuclease subunit S [Phocaeicola plebeius]|jgi:type I restriction enzyme S subunit|uniref:Restriction endonuclease subunit S n=1 Tax=Phocaeicola plebeius TaxID=310297 RepID=A0A3E4Z714_9BACT|nr:restriction endonuclease subunit S [Phocaeicola plebeius]RGM88756.1 restriction endonuclease subunit S [Phocaeicola plebeius]RGQ72649.1 restriction endonuclease subunit S [Phocaeicola plebeius]RGQ91944.1 restriction endonuclease subunit S [Phocaeicola plebeius]
MSVWKKVKIKDIAILDNGINFNKSAYASGIKIIGVSDFKDRFSPDFSTLQEVKEEIVRSEDYLQPGDILFVRSNGNRDLVGRCMLIDKNILSTFSGFCIRLRINDKNTYNPYFFTYHFKAPLFRKSIAGSAIGANIQNLSQNRLGNYELNIPEYFIQCRIAEILFRYDSLIENYQKQIKLLEEAAQRLYKEWFVDLRFPGYEKTKIVDGVPEGWEKKKVGDLLCKVQRTRQVPATYYQRTGLIPIIDQGKDYIAGYTNDNGCLVKVDDIPYIIFGDHTRILKYINFSFAKGADGVQLIMSNNHRRMPQSLLYASLVNIDLSNYSYARHFKYLKEQVILLPSEDLSKKYDDVVSFFYRDIKNLRKQMCNITEARDRLLPKLMSGEIEV